MNGTIIDLFDLQNDLGGQSCKYKFLLEKLVEQIVTFTHLSQDDQKYELRVFKTLIDLLDLQNDLGGQSYKSKLFLENLVEQIVTYTHLSYDERNNN